MPMDTRAPGSCTTRRARRFAANGASTRNTACAAVSRQRKRGVTMLSGVVYERIDDAGLHIRVDGVERLLAVDTIVVCAGQEPRRDLAHLLDASSIAYTLIGGA